MLVIFTAAAQRAFGLVLAPVWIFSYISIALISFFNFSFVYFQAGLPVLTIPFVCTAAMFLSVSSGTGKERLFKATDGRSPEYQRWRHQQPI